MDGHSLLRWAALKSNMIATQPRRIPNEEVALHCTIDDAWIILFGKVYDITQFVKFHPGGIDPILSYLGRDCTAAFGIHCFLIVLDETHSWVSYHSLLDKFLVGFVV